MPDDAPDSPPPETPAKPAPAPLRAPKKRSPSPKEAPPASSSTTPAASAPPIRPKSALAAAKGPIAWKKSPTAPSSKPARAPSGPAPTVVDVSGLVLGRSASLIAQRLLKGEHIVVVNAEKVVITGSRPRVLSFYIANRARGSVRSGPHFPRYPDRIYRRTVRGMLPHLKTRGKLAYDRLEVFIGCPSGYQSASHDWLGPAKARPSVRALITLGEVSKLLGARL